MIFKKAVILAKGMYVYWRKSGNEEDQKRGGDMSKYFFFVLLYWQIHILLKPCNWILKYFSGKMKNTRVLYIIELYTVESC